MKLVIFIHNLNYRCGALSHYVVLANKLEADGINVHFVYFDRAIVNSEYLNIKQLSCSHYSEAVDVLRESDIWMADHFPLLDHVRSINYKYRKPLIITVHFLSMLDSICKKPADIKWPERVLCFNTFSKNYLAGLKVKATVLGPLINESDIHVAPDTFDTDRRVSVGDINIRKGVHLFTNIVSQLPDVQFFGVKSYNEIQDSTIPLRRFNNIQILNFVSPVSLFLRRVRILLVPSITESWCRIAFEAMYNGIPVIYTAPYKNTTGIAEESTEGMQEWIQDGAMSRAHNDVAAWCEAIRRLDNEDEYEMWSKKARGRASKLKVFTNTDKYKKLIMGESNYE
jgi:glycosyltransferase involved in cell wall biosynthesis